jgi:hypothetical protein
LFVWGRTWIHGECVCVLLFLWLNQNPNTWSMCLCIVVSLCESELEYMEYVFVYCCFFVWVRTRTHGVCVCAFFSLHVAERLESILVENVWHSQSAIKPFIFIFTISRLLYQRGPKHMQRKIHNWNHRRLDFSIRQWLIVILYLPMLQMSFVHDVTESTNV